MTRIRTAIALLIASAVVGTALGFALVASGMVSSYGYDDRSVHAGVTVGASTGGPCLGFETRGTVEMFDCADPNNQ